MRVADIIHGFNNAVPFEPYEIKMVSGERYEVDHPDFVSISRNGNYVIVVDHRDLPRHLNPMLIEHAAPMRPRRRPGRAA
jgi:hypothetical protein